MLRRSIPLLLTGALFLASCADQPTRVDSTGDVPPDLLRIAPSLVDGNNGDTAERVEGFYWLRPLTDARPNSFDGVADPTLRPVLEICERNATGDGCAPGQPLVQFRRDQGPDQDRIKIDDDDHYYAHWRMNDYTPEREGIYRIRVTLQGEEFGHADVIVLRQRDIRAYSAPPGDAIIPISDRGAFKITFRLEEGVLEERFCDFDNDNDAGDCQAVVETPGDGIDTEVNISATDQSGNQVVAAKITAPDGVFQDANGNVIEDVVLTAEVEILPPSNDVFINDALELPFFIEVNTFPDNVVVDPNGPGITVVVCQDETVLAQRGVTTLALMQQLILYKVSDNGQTQRLVSNVGAPECGPAPVQSSGGGIAALFKGGVKKLVSLVTPQPLRARRLHGGMNTVIRSGPTLEPVFSTFGAALGPNAGQTTAVVPGGEIGETTTLTVQVRDALGNDFPIGGDTLQASVVSGPNQGAAFTVTDAGNGLYTLEYVPTAVGVDTIEINLKRFDGTLLGPIGGSPYTSAVTGPTIVTNTADSGPGSLRAALLTANQVPGPDVVTFAIPGNSAHVITLTSPLPAITDAVVIDGASQPNYAGIPVVEINGGQTATAGYGLEVQASGVTIRGLSLTNHQQDGIFVLSGSGTVIEDNFIGTDGNGTPGKGNAGVGLRLRGANGIVRDNLISGNAFAGILMDAGGTGNSIESNFIGLAPDAVTPLGNGSHGINMFNGASGTVIRDNIIAGNGGVGVDIQHSGTLAQVTNTVLRGNVIGLGVTGALVNSGGNRGNAGGGVRVNNAPGTQIGVAGDGNVISGNTGSGVLLIGPPVSPAPTVRANTIGLNPTGSAARANTADGVTIGTDGVVVGGPSPADRNLISGNDSDGVETIAGASGIVVEGNWIGLDASGTSAVGNGFTNTGCCRTGIFLRTGGNTARDNVVAGNWAGIRSGDPGGPANLIENNFIGTGPNGTQDLGNQEFGVGLLGDVSGTIVRTNVVRFNGYGFDLSEGGVSNTRIGQPGAGNTISNNDGVGILVRGSAGSGNRIRSNSITGNGGLGIDLNDDFVTANDPLDADTGPNGLVNTPVLVSAQNGVVQDSTQVQIQLSAAPNTLYGVELFANATCDVSGFGEGASPIGFFQAPAPTDGNGQLTFAVRVTAVADGTVVTATATDPNASTSEFSGCVTVTTAPVGPTITSIQPGNAAAGFGQMIAIEGSSFPASPTVNFNQGGVTLAGSVFGGGSPNLIVVRLPSNGLSASGQGVPTDVQVVGGGQSSNVVNLPVTTQPGTPVVLDILEGLSASSCPTNQSVTDGFILIGNGSYLTVRAYGIDTAGSEVRITQNGFTWTAFSTCNVGIPLTSNVPVPALGQVSDNGQGAFATGTAQVQVRTTVNGVPSAWSTPITLTFLTSSEED